ncbi:MAG TPA: DUF4389 domain-containing protein [Acidimicrobiia bacterium]|jgi:hypothetical protein|nr:DUF4389 domain-containing protein [Acidimicrobiia bacterium]
MYPIGVRAQLGDGQRSRGLAATGLLLFLKALLLFPHLVIVAVLSYAAGLIAWIGYWVIAITGSIPDFFFTFPTRTLEWSVRATGWLVSFDDAYPPFEWENDSYSTQLTVNEQPGPRSRLLGVLGIVGLKGLALLPHILVLMFVGLAAGIAIWVGYVAILFTGKLPEGIYNFTLGAVRWGNRLTAWAYSLTDEYPPFSLST